MKRDELEQQLTLLHGYVVNKQDCASILGVSTPSIDRLMSSSSISFFKVGNRPNSAVRFEISEIVDFIYRNKVIASEQGGI